MFLLVTMQNFIIAQLFGVVAVVVVTMSYFCKDKKKFFLLQLTENFILSGSYLFLGTYFSFVGLIVAVFRTLIFYFFERNKKDVPNYVVGLLILVLVSNCIIFWKDAWDLLPLFSLMFFTFAFKIKNMQLIRGIILIACCCFLVFNVIKMAYVNAILKVIEITFIILAMIKFSKQKNKETKVIVEKAEVI